MTDEAYCFLHQTFQVCDCDLKDAFSNDWQQTKEIKCLVCDEPLTGDDLDGLNGFEAKHIHCILNVSKEIIDRAAVKASSIPTGQTFSIEDCFNEEVN